jgi:hypothetical protein
MVRTLRFGKFEYLVFNERGAPHHEPHFHVRWPDGRSSVKLKDMTVLRGSKLPRAAKRYAVEHKAELEDAWQRLNEEASE